MRSPELREKALELRKIGKTYTEIGSLLGVPKGTLSYWLSDLALGADVREYLVQKRKSHILRIQKIAVESRQRQHMAVLRSIQDKVSYFKDKQDQDSLKIALAFLYLGEGAKWKSHRGLQLGSSDPLIMSLYVNLLRLCYGIDKDQLRCYICYRADQHLPILQKFWSKELGISLENFYPSKPDKRTEGKATRKKDYRGVCVIYCAGTHIQHELEYIVRQVHTGL